MLPVVGRELLVSARRPASYWTRSGFVALLLLLVALVAWNWDIFQVSAQAGMAVFGVSAGLLFLYSLASGLMLTADCLSSERREGTLPLLFLTDLNAAQVVWGKLICSSFQGVYFFISVIPTLSLGFLFGGIEWRSVILILAVLLNTLLVSLELGVYVSSRSVMERKAIMATLLAVGIWLVGPLLVEQLTLGRFFLSVFSDPQYFTVGFFSPLTQFLAVDSNSVSITGRLLAGIVCSQFTGLILVWLAARSLSNSKTGEEAQVDRRSKDQTSRGQRQHSYRSRLLDLTPTQWLTARQPYKREAALLFTVTVLMLITVLLFIPFEEDARIAVLCGGIFFISCFVKLWTLFETCQRSFEDRQTGALELMLTTPLSVPEMASGFHRALRSWFLLAVPLPCLLYVIVFLIFATALPGESVVHILVNLLVLVVTAMADLWALSWVGLWQAVRSRSTLRACARTWLILFGPTALLLVLLISLERVVSLILPESVSMRWIVLGTYTTVGLLTSLPAGFRARRLYLDGLREVAVSRFENRAAAKNFSFATFLKRLPAGILRSPIRFVRWTRMHPIWGGFCLLLLLLPFAQALRVRNLDMAVNRRVAEIAASGWPTNYSVFRELRNQSVAKGWIEAKTKLTQVASSYVDAPPRPRFGNWFDPLSVPDAFSTLSTNQIGLVRAHLARNSNYFDSIHTLSQADWIDISSLESVRIPQVYYTIRSLAPRRIDPCMLSWKGLMEVHDNQLNQATDRVEQMLRIARIWQRTHRYFGLNSGRNFCSNAAELTERILSQASPDIDLLRRLQHIWKIPEEEMDIRPELHQAFVELATGWERLISRNAAKLSYQPGIGRLTLPLLSSAEHFTGRHQLAALATLDSYTNLPHWNSLLVASQPIPLNNDGPDSVILGSMDSRQDELIRIINARRQILGQSRTVRVALALREAQLESPSAGKSQWLKSVTNQPSFSPFAPDLKYLWQTNGFVISTGTRPASYSNRGEFIRFEVRRKDWQEPLP